MHSFGLFEYTAGEVIEQARRKGIRYCFAKPTVLEAWDNPAFCPAPHSAAQGRIVNLRGNSLARLAQEVLHSRFEHSARHMICSGVWQSTLKPDVEVARKRHMVLLRKETGRPEYGKVEQTI